MKYHRSPFLGVSRSRQVWVISYIQFLQPFRLILQAYFILLIEMFQIVSFYEFPYSMYVFHAHIACFEQWKEGNKWNQGHVSSFFRKEEETVSSKRVQQHHWDPTTWSHAYTYLLLQRGYGLTSLNKGVNEREGSQECSIGHHVWYKPWWICGFKEEKHEKSFKKKETVNIEKRKGRTKKKWHKERWARVIHSRGEKILKVVVSE